MKYTLLLFTSALIFVFGCKNDPSKSMDYRLIQPLNSDSTVNMIVEIPAGTTAKYEMDKGSYQLVQDSIDGRPRFIDYLGYPGNYGMIPNTLLSKQFGGDGDPLDILLLGPSVEKGSVQKVEVIGVLELLDNGEQDDKLIAIDPISKWSSVNDMNDLDSLYPGVKTMVVSFFQNYKGKGQMKLKGWSGKARAKKILENAIQSSK